MSGNFPCCSYGWELASSAGTVFWHHNHLDNTQMLIHQILLFNSQFLGQKTSAKRHQNPSSNVLRGKNLCRNSKQLKYLYLYKLWHVKYSERVNNGFGNSASHTGYQIQEGHFVAILGHPVFFACRSKWIYH